MDKESPACDQFLTIVNRKREYIVSKKFICSSVPYFEKMFNSDLLESKKNKVEFDFDEHVFDSILDWIHSETFFIQMDNVLSFYEAADYLMINERLLNPCLTYFHEKFTIKHLPVVWSQVTKVTKLVNSGSIENMICRFFLQIVNTDVFLDYPFETVEAIFKLDLMVYSEIQVFNSIIEWVDRNDSRKKFLPRLLNCVRWCFMDAADLSVAENNELIKALPGFKPISTSNVVYEFDRCKQFFFVFIQQLDNSAIRIKAFDSEFYCFTIGDFTQDGSIILEFVNSEHISDILFDSGTKGVRIDWLKKTFRWLDFKDEGNTYYNQLIKFFEKFSNPRYFSCYLEDKEEKLKFPLSVEEKLILESDGQFIVIGKTFDDKKWFGLFPALDASWFYYFKDHEHSFRATVLDDFVYILTKNLEFIQFDYKTRYFDKSEPFKDEKFNFNDLILTSHPKNDNKVILINKSNGVVHVFCIHDKKWTEKYRIMNVKHSPNNSSSTVNKYIAFTPAFLSMKFIKPNKQYAH